MSSQNNILILTELRGNQLHTMRPEIEMFISLVKHGFDITLMTNGDSICIPALKRGGVRIIDFYPTSKFNKTEIQYVRQELTTTNYNILFLVTDNRAITTGIQAARGLPVKVAVYRGYSGNLSWLNPVSYTKHLHPRVDLIVCNGKAVIDYFKRQPFFNKKKLFGFVKGHSIDWYEDVIQEDISMYSTDPETFHLVWAGHNRPRMKGLQSLLKAISILKNENVILHLIGSNTKTDENVEIISKGDISDKVIFHPPMEDPRPLVKACDAFILPSLKGEGVNRGTLEAMSMGVTPLVSDFRGNADLVENGVSGIVFRANDPASISDAIKRVLKDREMNKMLGNGAMERIRTVLGHEENMGKLARAFRELV